MHPRLKAYLQSTPGRCGIAAFTLIALGAILQAMTDGSSMVALMLWAVAILFIAAMLYSVRRSKRWIYGIVEAAFGFLACLGVLFVARYGAPTDGFTVPAIAARMLALMTCAYVAVRAYDNLGDGLPQGSAIAAWWSRVFPKAG
jgi:hypothetical protein